MAYVLIGPDGKKLTVHHAVDVQEILAQGEYRMEGDEPEPVVQPQEIAKADAKVLTEQAQAKAKK